VQRSKKIHKQITDGGESRPVVGRKLTDVSAKRGGEAAWSNNLVTVVRNFSRSTGGTSNWTRLAASQAGKT